MNKPRVWSKRLFHKKELILDPIQKSWSYICPRCHQVLTLKEEITEPTIMTCPSCGQKGMVYPQRQQLTCVNTHSPKHSLQFADHTTSKNRVSIPAVEVKILGILLLVFGILLHFVFNYIPIKVSIVLIIIGIIIFTFIPSTRKIPLNFSNNTTKEKPPKEMHTHASSLQKFLGTFLLKQFDIAEKIALILILWIVLTYIITGINDIDIFFIFVYLGILLMKVFSTEYISSRLKRKINVFVVAFLVIFIFVIARRILTIVSL